MIQLSADYKRNLLFTNTNKALLEIVKNATPEQLNQLQDAKDPKSVLASLFQDKLTQNKSDRLLSELLKSSPQFKTMGNFNDKLKTLINELKSTPTLSTAALEKFLQNGSQLSSQTLQQQMKNSGVFMESKISAFLQSSSQPPIAINLAEIKSSLLELYTKLQSDPLPQSDKLLNGIEKLLNTLSKATPLELKTLIQELNDHPLPKTFQEPVSRLLPKLTALLHAKEPPIETTLSQTLADDLKSSLMTLAKELQESDSPPTPKQLDLIDKLLLQIDYHQLQSHLSNATSLYFPFAWEQLEEGSILFKKKDTKKAYCHVNLRFKEYGELTLLMSLYDEHQLELHFHSEMPSLNLLIKTHLESLRGFLIQAGFMIKTLRVHEESEKQLHDAYTGERHEPGFEVKV